jgi:hypothetical protein
VNYDVFGFDLENDSRTERKNSEENHTELLEKRRKNGGTFQFGRSLWVSGRSLAKFIMTICVFYLAREFPNFCRFWKRPPLQNKFLKQNKEQS